jgi:sugar lactone lactonase YvrE
VFGTSADGGEITTLTVGGLLEAPVSIAISLDGRTLLVADSAANGTGQGGAILALPATGGDASVVAGTEGYVPSGLAVAKIGNEERLYFTGREPSSGRAGLFFGALNGGNVEALAEDAVFGDPTAVAVDADGTAYVVDALNETGSASLVRVRKDKAETVAEGIGVGFPAGGALTQDGSTVLVSGVHPTTGRDVVYLVDASNGKVSVLSKPFAEFIEAAGLHRAHDGNVFAWADGEANGSGTVYVLKL